MKTKKDQHAARLALRRALVDIVRRFPELKKPRAKRRLERYLASSEQTCDIKELGKKYT